jgi:hypothetical protein
VKVCGLTREEDVAVAVEAGADLVGFILARETPRARPRVLDVPDTVLSVAVFVEDVARRRADLVQLYARENGHRGATPCCCATAEVARVVDLPWQEDDPSTSARPRRRGRVMLAGGSRRRTSRRDRRVRPVGGRRELVARDRARDQGSRRACARSSRRRDADVRRVRRALRARDADPALDELEAGWRDALADDAFHAELHHLLTTYAAARRRSRSPTGSRPASASTSSARTCSTPERTS